MSALKQLFAVAAAAVLCALHVLSLFMIAVSLAVVAPLSLVAYSVECDCLSCLICPVHFENLLAAQPCRKPAYCLAHRSDPPLMRCCQSYCFNTQFRAVSTSAHWVSTPACVPPGDDKRAQALSLGDAVSQGIIANQTLAYFIGRTWLFFLRVGVDPARMRFRQHLQHEMAHYAGWCDGVLLMWYVGCFCVYLHCVCICASGSTCSTRWRTTQVRVAGCTATGL